MSDGVDEESYRRQIKVLELQPGASVLDVRKAYLHLKDLYTRDSIATSSLLDGELPEERKQEILEEIEDAYRGLMVTFEQSSADALNIRSSPVRTEEIKREVSSVERFTGPALKALREKLGVELYDIELSTKINSRHLEAIEAERYDMLPAEVFVRGYLSSYAKCLMIDPARVVSEYIEGYGRWKSEKG